MENTQWRKKAACSGVDTEIFVAPLNVTVTVKFKQRALSYCNVCPVKKECLNYAFENNIQHGIYGGMTNKDRRKNLYAWKRGEL